jgi:hypothetical protein
MDKFYQNRIQSILDLDEKEELLKKAQKDYESASQESDYSSVLTDLLKIEIPENVNILLSSDRLTFYPERNVIDLDVLEVALLDGRGSIISKISDDLNDDTLKKQIKYALNDALTRKLDTGIKDAAELDLNVDFKL